MLPTKNRHPPAEKKDFHFLYSFLSNTQTVIVAMDS